MAKRPVPKQFVGKNFQKGDPRINRKGAPKKIVRQRKLIAALLGLPAYPTDSEISDSEIGKIFKALMTTAKRGNVAAIREVLDRCYGKVKEAEAPLIKNQIIWEEKKQYIKK